VEQIRGTPITRSQMVAVICRIRTGFFQPIAGFGIFPTGKSSPGSSLVPNLECCPNFFIGGLELSLNTLI
jgi:hypothetical protein